MKRKLFKCVFLMIGFLTFIATPEATVQATEGVGYSVTPNLPENQLTNSNYFDLLVEPGAEQELSFTLTNERDSAIQVQSSFHNTWTNRNGVIIYGEADAVDSSLTDPLTELVELEEEIIHVPANGTTEFTTIVEVPEDPFAGIKLGGFRFEEVIDESENDSNTVQNRYSYTIALSLTQQEEVPLDLELLDVQTEIVSARPAIVASIQNFKPTLATGLQVDARLYRSDNLDEAILEFSQDNVQMAPNSTLPFTMNLEGQLLEAGDYVLDINASSSDNQWHWNEEFTIDESDQELIEDNTIENEENNVPMWVYIGLGLVGLVILSLLLYIWKLKKNNQTEE